MKHRYGVGGKGLYNIYSISIYDRRERKDCRVGIGLGGWERPGIERVW